MTPTALHRSAGPPPEPPRLQALPNAAPSDAELVARSLDDPEAFAPLFDRHAVSVHRYLGRRVGELADDLLSETFLIAFRRRAAYRPEHVQVRPWLLGIATNLVHGHVRTEQRRYKALARAAAEPERPGSDPGDSADRLDAAALRGPLAAALAALEPRTDRFTIGIDDDEPDWWRTRSSTWTSRSARRSPSTAWRANWSADRGTSTATTA